MKITIRQEQVTTRGWQGWRSSTPGPLEAGMASSNLDFKDVQLSSLGGRSPTKCSTTGSPNSFNTTASRAMFAPFALAIGHRKKKKKKKGGNAHHQMVDKNRFDCFLDSNG